MVTEGSKRRTGKTAGAGAGARQEGRGLSSLDQPVMGLSYSREVQLTGDIGSDPKPRILP